VSYWDRVLALSYRLQADVMARGRILSGERPAALIAELRARAAAIDPGADVPLPGEERPVTLAEWLRGIRSIEGETPQVQDWVQPAGAHDAVRLGEYRAHGGTTWRSLVDYNVWPPAEGDLWTEDEPALDEEPGEPVSYTPWAPGLAVVTGQLLSHVGRIWRVVQSHTTAAHWVPGSPGLEALYADEGPAP
jgi:hypothetical protein